MAKRLKELRIEKISIVLRGAVGRKAIFKSKDSLEVSVPLTKSDDTGDMMYGIVYPVNDIDSDGDTMTAEEVIKARDYFMRNAKNREIDENHDLRNIGDDVYLVESWIVKEIDGVKDNLFPEPENLGAWAVGIKIENKEKYKQFKEGKYELSLFGTSKGYDIIPDEDVKKEHDGLKAMFKAFGNKLGLTTEELVNTIKEEEPTAEEATKDFNKEVNEDEQNLWKYFDLLYWSVYKTVYSDNNNKINLIKQDFEQFLSKIETLEVVKSLEEDEMTKEEINAIVTEQINESATKFKATDEKIETMTETINTLTEALGKAVENINVLLGKVEEDKEVVEFAKALKKTIELGSDQLDPHVSLSKTETVTTSRNDVANRMFKTRR